MKFSPRDEFELADAVRGRTHTFEIVGNATKRGLGGAVAADAMLDVSGISGILRYEPDELVITACAGTPIAEIEAVLAEHKQRLGFEPADWAALYGAAKNCATIGGVLSADASGSARLRYGAARDHLLGYRAVNGWGEVYRAGGRVVKNVTGFDLPKLLCGAMGTLGVMTEVTLRLVPKPDRAAILAINDVEAREGLALLRRVWSSPLEATGLAYLPSAALGAFPELADAGRGAALIRIEGAPAPLADKFALLDATLKSHGAFALDDGDAVFDRIASGRAFAQCRGELWRVFVPPAEAPAAADMLGSPFWLADWAGGVLWLEIEPQRAGSIMAIASRFGGHARLMRGSPQLAAPLPEPLALLMQRVKEAFDPFGLFNPGRLADKF